MISRRCKPMHADKEIFVLSAFIGVHRRLKCFLPPPLTYTRSAPLPIKASSAAMSR
jgi:hypothetical protein